jgi:hypothetical protein
MEPARKQCIFCKVPTTFKGDEHVISRWILVKLGELKSIDPWKRHEVKAGGNGLFEYSTLEERVANYDQLRSGFVCDSCNSDLNLKLEIPFQQIKPDLITYPFRDYQNISPFLRGPNPLTTLTIEERQIIARWAAKTTCVIESVTPGRKEEQNWISADAEQVRVQSALPDGWAIFAMLHSPTRPIFMSGSRSWIIDSKMPQTLRNGLAKTPRTVIQIGSLILLTIHIADPRLYLQAVKGIHYPLVSNIEIEWLDRPRDPRRRIAPEERLDSSVNLSLRLADTLFLTFKNGGSE